MIFGLYVIKAMLSKVLGKDCSIGFSECIERRELLYCFLSGVPLDSAHTVTVGDNFPVGGADVFLDSYAARPSPMRY